MMPYVREGNHEPDGKYWETTARLMSNITCGPTAQYPESAPAPMLYIRVYDFTLPIIMTSSAMLRRNNCHANLKHAVKYFHTQN